MTIAQDFLDAVIHRARRRMEPVDFEVDWADMPRRGKFYPGIEQVALDELDLPRGVDGWGLGELADMLRATYAESDRRLAVHANSDVDDLPRYDGASMSRGVASGGGRYPVSIYWLPGPGHEVAAGAYYYSTAQHTLQRLHTGDLTGRITAALGADAAPAAQYLVLGIKFWQNSFKYNSFCFHAVSMDIGTITEAWRLWAAENGLDLRPSLWFDEPAVGELLGLDLTTEGAFAIIALPSTQAPSAPVAGAARLQVGRRDHERSKRVLEFETLTEMQKATVDGCTDRPAAASIRGASRTPGTPGPEVTLPPPLAPKHDVAQSLHRRRSSFGRFTAQQPMTAAELGTLLAAGVRSGRFDCDVADGGLDLLTLYVFVNHVRDVAPGAYRYEPDRHVLVRIAAGEYGAFLQEHYYLENYNLEQTGAVIVPAVRAAAVLDAAGDRGYRLVNAVVGAVSQGLYLAAASIEVGCGAALGFDNVAYMEQLHIDGTDTVPLIIVMTGHERGAQANYRYQIH